MDVFIKLLLGIALIPFGYLSVQMAIRGVPPIPNCVIPGTVKHPLALTYSLIFAWILVPCYMGDYGRGESSPLPWVEFMTQLNRHGVYDAITGATMVSLVALWICWIPTALYLDAHPEHNSEKRITIRAINVIVGLWIIGSANPILMFFTEE